MKEIALKIADYESIYAQQGAEAAVEAIRAKIQSEALDLPIELTKRTNSDNEQVTSLCFVNAAAWKRESKGFRVNLLTCGFAANDDLSISRLFSALTKPTVPVVVRPDLLAADEEPPHVAEKEVFGLLVGSHAHPTAFITFEP
jgi:hypothetical protein